MECVLRRSVRFAVNTAPGGAGPNTYAASPPVRGLGRYFELRVEAAGGPDPRSGYLVNIKEIDCAVRERVVPLVAAACDGRGPDDPAALLAGAFDSLDGALPAAVRAIELALSPYHAVAMEAANRGIAVTRIRFDFSASHRLHVPEWSDEQNRELFGKCNSPSGHGHNYQLEPAVETPASGGAPLDVDALERVVQREVIERFDHKHLNVDTREFSPEGGLNPTVENIARVCYELLREPVAGLGHGVRLRSVRVWETDRTSSEYPG